MNALATAPGVIATGVQKAIKPAIEYYRYLGGIIDEKSGL